MMPEMEVLPILIGNKKIAKLILLYNQDGWTAQIVTKRIDGAEVIGRGSDRLGPDSARALALDLGGKWRDQEVRQRRD